jgi:transposase
MNEDSVVYVGVDAAKAKHAVAIAESGRSGEVRYVGEIETTPAAVERFVRKLARKHPRLPFCYEAGPTGYGLYRQLVALGHACEVVAPSLIPKRPGEHVKTNRRDAVTLARLLRAGELKGIGVPDAVQEAVRDLVRAREAAGEDLRKKRQQLPSFLLRHGRMFTGRKAWSPAHSRWLAAQRFEHPAQQIVFQDQVDVIADAGQRLERLDAQLVELVPPGQWLQWWRLIRRCVGSRSLLPSRLSAKSVTFAGSTVPASSWPSSVSCRPSAPPARLSSAVV